MLHPSSNQLWLPNVEEIKNACSMATDSCSVFNQLLTPLLIIVGGFFSQD
jgi:hypothetical protein